MAMETPIPALAATDSPGLPEPEFGLDEGDMDEEVVEVSFIRRWAYPRTGAERGVNRDRSRFSHSTHIPEARPVNAPDVEMVWVPSMYHVGVAINWPHWSVHSWGREPVVDDGSTFVINSIELESTFRR